MRWLMQILVALGLAPPPAAEVPVDPAWPAVVTGYQFTREAAREHALAEAVRQVTDYVRQLQPPLLEWTPDEKYVVEKLLLGPGSPGPDVNIDQPQKANSWVLKLKSPDLAEFQRLNRLALENRWKRERLTRSQERLHWTAWAVLGAVAVLAIGSVYGRWRMR